MQQPLPTATTTIAATPPLAPPVPPAVHNPSVSFIGWYPRWWFLSALSCLSLVALVYLLQPYVCKGRIAGSLLCQFSQWTDWREGLVIASIWLLFLLFWVAFMILGIRPLELTSASRKSLIARFLVTISQVRPVYVLLLIYSGLALIFLGAMWLRGFFHPAAYAACWMLLFVTNSAFFHRLAPRDRKLYLIAYGVIGVVVIVVMWLTDAYQAALLVTMLLLILSAIWAIFFYRPGVQTSTPLTPEEALRAANAQMASPIEILRATLRSFRPGGGGSSAPPGP